MQTLIIFVLLLAIVSSMRVHPEAQLPFLEYCKYYNYPAEAHRVTTEDGYILTIYRLQKKSTHIK